MGSGRDSGISYDLLWLTKMDNIYTAHLRQLQDLNYASTWSNKVFADVIVGGFAAYMYLKFAGGSCGRQRLKIENSVWKL